LIDSSTPWWTATIGQGVSGVQQPLAWWPIVTSSAISTAKLSRALWVWMLVIACLLG
jgi:hypothetical protein